MTRLLNIAETRLAFALSIVTLLVSGLANHALIQSQSTLIALLTSDGFATLLQAVYYMAALRALTALTPRLLGQIRPAVNCDDARFAIFARRIAGGKSRHLFTLIAPALALIWLAAVSIQLFQLLPGQSAWLQSIIYTPLALTAILFSLVSLLRMWHLAQLARQPLHLNLFESSAVLPFGHLSSLYSLLIICGEMLHLVLLGVPTIGALAITSFSVLTSIAALLLPLWAVHQQMVVRKAEVLQVIEARLDQRVHSFIAEAAAPPSGSPSIPELHGLRGIVLSAPTWPIANVVSTMRALIVPFLPIIYVLAQQLLVPHFTAFLQSVGLLSK